MLKLEDLNGQTLTANGSAFNQQEELSRLTGDITDLKQRISDIGTFRDDLKRICSGGTVLDPEVVATVMARQEPVERLSAREREVMSLMAEGRSNAAIAAKLVVTEKAVAKHINSIFTKLDLPLGTDDHRRVRAVLTWLRL